MQSAQSLSSYHLLQFTSLSSNPTNHQGRAPTKGAFRSRAWHGAKETEDTVRKARRAKRVRSENDGRVEKSELFPKFASHLINQGLDVAVINKYRKDLVWRRVSEETGVAEDVCRKKWKGLRDTYLKERRKELEKRCGAAAGVAKKWRFSAILSFLDPVVAPRPTPSNMGKVDKMAEDLPAPPPEEETLETEGTLPNNI
ncbi:hypothetical protein CRENBAI_015986 [Crenichthys baileyi]|uniref:MADF domain-containing protein n=1 Tax=Crenichthys baileyi TaxID=28760 RepID=A0AAV9RY80_9TELE